MNVEEWFEKYKFKCDSFRDIKRLVKIKKEKKLKISVCLHYRRGYHLLD